MDTFEKTFLAFKKKYLAFAIEPTEEAFEDASGVAPRDRAPLFDEYSEALSSE